MNIMQCLLSIVIDVNSEILISFKVLFIEFSLYLLYVMSEQISSN